MTVEIDGVLKEWGDRLFYTPIRPRGAKRTITRTTVDVSAHSKPRTPTGVRRQLTETIRKAPEVMVKISGGGKGMRQIGAHLDYISRNGGVTLENDAGEHVDGRAAVNDLKNEWTHGLYGIPMESRRREAFNIVLSMPPGTNRDAVMRAARRFAQSEFSANHHYVFAAHDDEKHPHIHLCVQAQGIDGTRLNPRKADLQRWREHFAEKLREQGVRANATPRTARGVSKRSKRQQSIHRASRVSREALPLTSKQAPQRTQDNFSASQRAALTAYRQIAAGLARSPNNEDRRLALGIVEFVRQMPALRDRNPPTASRDTPVAEPALKPSTGQDRDR